MNIQDVIAKVQKLRRLATSDNVHEAAAAAAAADRLIQEHGLAESQVEATSTEARESAALDPDAIVSWAGKVPQWALRLAVDLVRHYQCACYLNHGRSMTGAPTTAVRIVGRPSDVASVRYMYAWLASEIDSLARRHARGGGRSFVNAYRHGAVVGVIEAMRAEREAMKQRAREAGQTAALAVYDSRRAEAHQALKAAVPDLRRGKAIGGARDAGGFERGREAGRNIHRGASLGAGTGTHALPGGAS